MIVSASTRPTPAECVTHTDSPTQNPRRSGCSPISGYPSGVNANTPLKLRSSVVSRRAGISSHVSSQGSAKSSAVKA